MRFYQKWEGRSCHPDRNAWFPATVPGNIQKDYAVANDFADVQFADNYKQFLPLEDDHWEYRTELNYEKKNGERVFFVTEGIQYRYDILLNGEVLLSYEGLFRGNEVELTDKLKKNIEYIGKYCGKSKLVFLPQVKNLEDELVRCSSVAKVTELTQSKSISNFKTDFCRISNARAVLTEHQIDVLKLWSTNPPEVFAFVPRNSEIIKL